MRRSFVPARLVLSAMLAVLVMSSGRIPGNAAVVQKAAGPDRPKALADAQPAVSGHLIVAFADRGQSKTQVAAELAQRGLALEQWLPELGLARATVRSGSEGAAISALDQDPAIDYVTEERRSVQVADTPQDEYWSGQWGPAKVGLPAARDVTVGDPSVVIAVVDTGVRYFHWDLHDQMWINPGESEIDPLTGKRTCDSGVAINGQDDDQNGYTDDCRGYNFDQGNSDPGDAYGHGTVVAGIAGAATNNLGHYTSGQFEGIAGMGGAARIMPLRALGADGRGTAFNIAEAIRYAGDEGAQIINLSLTLAVNYNQNDADTLCRATDYAQSKGSLVVGASGNHSQYWAQPVSYPAACPGVLAVGASTQADARAYFSDSGSRLDLIAPGEGISSTLMATDTSYGRWANVGSGTSFAAPHAAGAAALVRSLRPDLSPASVTELLRNTAHDVGDPGFDDATGWGRLDVGRAVAQALDGLKLGITADPPGTATGASTQLRIRVTGPGGVPAGFGARISLSGALGAVSPQQVIADSSGIAIATFTGGPSAGVGGVTAAVGSLSTSIPITISLGTPASISLTTDRSILPTRGRSTIIASVVDEGGNPVAGAFDVTFAVSGGLVDPVTATAVGGKAQTSFTAPPVPGKVQVTAVANGVSATPLEVEVVRPVYLPLLRR
jgi:subtilisin family serine protease